jgi:hypothetical protein
VSFPTQRLTITPGEYKLLWPGLDVMANGLASAKFGAFPHRHPYHRIDCVATDIYRDQAYDDEMGAKIMSLRGKLWEPSQSRKIRLDAFQLAAAGFALRLLKAHRSTEPTQVKPDEIRLLQAKIEAYRKRAKRAAIVRAGKSEYEAAAKRWKRFAAWSRYNLMFFKLPKRGQPLRANLWREQRQRLTEVISRVLAEHFYQVPNDQEMARIVTLATTSLRRCRHSVGLRELLCDPHAHSDFLLGFVEKRINLNRLPGAPVPPWQQITDRADKFRAYRERHDEQAVGPSDGLESGQMLQIQRPVTTKVTEMVPIKPRSNARILVSDEALVEAMAQILHDVGGMKLSEAIAEQARFQIQRDLDQYRRPTAARTLNGLVKELRPSDYSTFLPDLINQYVEWLLGLMLALGREASLIYKTVGAALFRARQLEGVGLGVK